MGGHLRGGRPFKRWEAQVGGQSERPCERPCERWEAVGGRSGRLWESEVGGCTSRRWEAEVGD